MVTFSIELLNVEEISGRMEDLEVNGEEESIELLDEAIFAMGLGRNECA
jgi:hypothetical protein